MKLVPMAVIVILALLAFPSEAASTSEWQILTYLGEEQTSIFEANQTVNITVYPPSFLVLGGNRVLVLESQKEDKELSRFSLGFYPGGNQTGEPENVTIPLAPYELIAGDILFLRVVVASSDDVEASVAITVNVDIDALLERQRNQILAVVFNELQERDAAIRALTRELVQTTNIVYALAILLSFVAVWSTKDILFKKKQEEQAKVDSVLGAWLESYIESRRGPGDK